MEINENAPGNISQSPVTRTTDNETGFDPGASEPETGNTESLPLANEPLVPGAVEEGPSTAPQDKKPIDSLPPNNPVDDPNVPVQPFTDEDDEPSPGNR